MLGLREESGGRALLGRTGLAGREHVERAGLAERELVERPGRATRLMLVVGQGQDPSGVHMPSNC